MLAGLLASSLASPRLFQTVAELYFAGCAYAVLMIAWNLRTFTADDFALTAARLLALAGVLELLHALSAPGLDLIPNSTLGMSLQFSIAAGFVLAGGFLVAPFIVGRRINEPVAVFLTLAVGTALVASIVWFDVFPATLTQAGAFSAFARVSPLVCALALIGGVAILHYRRLGPERNARWELSCALLAMAGWQLSLSAFPAPTRPQTIVSHTLMVAAAYLLYRAVAETGLTVPAGLLLEHLKKDKAKSEQTYQALFDQVPVGVATFAADGHLRDCNESFTRLAGATREELLGTGPGTLCDRRIAPAIEKALAGEAGEYAGSFHSNGRDVQKWISLRSEPLTNGAGELEGCIAVVTDLTEGKQSEELIERLAFTDELTGLANRRLLHDRLRQAIAAAERSHQQVAVASVNLDRFRTVNDSFGITVGDSLLRAVAARLSELMRRSDTVCRSGGDQFILLVPGVKRASDAIAIADKICESFKRPWSVAEHEFHITASVGMAMYPADAPDAETLIEQSRTAMRGAKQEGGDCCHFYALSMNERASERFAMETALRRALDLDSAQSEGLLVCYQPQVLLKTGQVVGVEALVRWQHPELGMLSPARFIPLAEETQLITHLDRYVLRRACCEAHAWQELTGRSFRLAVNVSARQFRRHDLVTVVGTALQESGLPPECLELEITETVAMAGAERTAQILGQLQDLGVSIALDDFGTGFSSLSHLRQLPIDRLKVDCSFVTNLEDDPSAAAIIKAVLGLGETLGIAVMAEGVETPTQADYLISSGCREAQGYLYARPLSHADCEGLLVSHDTLPTAD